MDTDITLTEKHNFVSETIFQLKLVLLIAARNFQNLFSGLEKFKPAAKLKDHPVVSVSETELWNNDDTDFNRILTAGKIQNLRIGAKRLNGIEVPAGQVFSFWRHIGNPNIGKGYVIGREIREGCIIPTKAGGLCQLSNALYDAALQGGFEIIERHRHTQIIKGSLAEADRDATIKWNYVDLRFRSASAFRIEIDLTQDKLLVKFRSTPEKQQIAKPQSNRSFLASKLNDCYSCGNVSCFKHPGATPVQSEKQVTTFILDDKWAEYDGYLKTVATENDFFIVPLLKSKLIKTDRYNWTTTNPSNTKQVAFAGIQRAVAMRLLSGSKNNIFSLSLDLDQKLAKAVAKKIPIACTHLVVAQNLLPFLWEQGVFGGRTFDVLMTRLPMERLHERLDFAHSNYPQSKTLNDFRAPQALIDMENSALTKSRHIITPHAEIAGIFNNKSIKLDWIMPRVKESLRTVGNKILFPASALGRKGAYEVKRLALELNLSVVITGKAIEEENFWEGVKIERAMGDPFNNICLVVYPAYVEHRPTTLLKAIAAGIPIITTTACGIEPKENLVVVPVGDYIKLKEAIELRLNKQSVIADKVRSAIVN